MFLSLEEEGLLSKWMMIAGILIAIGAFLIELVMGFLQGGVFWAMRLSLMDILWCFGWFLIILGLFCMVKNAFFPPSQKKEVSAKLTIKVYIAVGILLVIGSAVTTFILAVFGGAEMLIIYVSFLRLLMIIGAGIFFLGILTSVKYFFGLILRFLWPFKKRKVC